MSEELDMQEVVYYYDDEGLVSVSNMETISTKVEDSIIDEVLSAIMVGLTCV